MPRRRSSRPRVIASGLPLRLAFTVPLRVTTLAGRANDRLFPFRHRPHAGTPLLDQRADRRHALARRHTAPRRLDLGGVERNERGAFAARGKDGDGYAAWSIDADS
jgi:hypothetical protein